MAKDALVESCIVRGARRNRRILEDGRVRRCEEAMKLLVLAAEVGMVVSEEMSVSVGIPEAGESHLGWRAGHPA